MPKPEKQTLSPTAPQGADNEVLIQNLMQKRKLQQEALIKIMAAIDLKEGEQVNPSQASQTKMKNKSKR
jgi:hypothetical protein